jgi:protein-L-isoaspartate(D-aspartate) O-methyltransferase
MSASPDIIREWFAQDLGLRSSVDDLAILRAFAMVPRERFLGSGPWRILPDADPDKVFVTPDAQSHWLYHDVLVSIDPECNLNNGLPSFWVQNFASLDLERGLRILQVGAGTGYYSAILAEIVGPHGAVFAVEYNQKLAAAARANLRPWPQVEVISGDGRLVDRETVDVVIVFAGSTHPAPLWLDRLTEGGRLLMPLTGENKWGFLLRVVRCGTAYEASSIGWVGIFHCAGGRDSRAGRRLERAVQKSYRSGTGVQICALHRGVRSAGSKRPIWYQGPGFWLEATKSK